MSESPVNILVVDDDPAVRAALLVGLEESGWIVHVAADHVGMMDEIDRGEIDLVALSQNLRRKGGIDLAQAVRARANIPLVLVDGLGNSDDSIVHFESEAEDSVAKPGLINQIVLRLKQLIERYGKSIVDDRIVAFDNYVFDMNRRTASHRDGGRINLTEMEANILELFLHHPRRTLGRDEIFKALHGRDWWPLDRTIDGHIARLRSKLEQTSDGLILIRTVRGVGYVFCGTVTPVSR